MGTEPKPPPDRLPEPGKSPSADGTDRTQTPHALRDVNPAIFQQPEQPPRRSPTVISESIFAPPFSQVQNVEARPGGASAKGEAGAVGVSISEARGEATGSGTADAAGEAIFPPIVTQEIPSGPPTYQLGGQPVETVRRPYVDSIEANSRFETLEARVALLESALASRPTVLGHNRGPALDENLEVDERGIRELIALLREQGPTAPVNLTALKEAAQVADPAINKWQERLDMVVKGLLFGAAKYAGEEIAKVMAQADWFQSVYSKLQSVFEAFLDWIGLFF